MLYIAQIWTSRGEHINTPLIWRFVLNWNWLSDFLKIEREMLTFSLKNSSDPSESEVQMYLIRAAVKLIKGEQSRWIFSCFKSCLVELDDGLKMNRQPLGYYKAMRKLRISFDFYCWKWQALAFNRFALIEWLEARDESIQALNFRVGFASFRKVWKSGSSSGHLAVNRSDYTAVIRLWMERCWRWNALDDVKWGWNALDEVRWMKCFRWNVMRMRRPTNKTTETRVQELGWVTVRSCKWDAVRMAGRSNSRSFTRIYQWLKRLTSGEEREMIRLLVWFAY